jgi:hypothetical protein
VFVLLLTAHVCHAVSYNIIQLTDDNAGNIPTGITGSITPTQNPILTDSIVATQTVIKAIHFIELRYYINKLRNKNSNSSYSLNDEAITPGETEMNTFHINEMQTALEDVIG